ncbi:protein Wnt-6-like isoform X2 [Paramormyrops kingsleyae]|uniref:protein Wnt-6-like isoform X2 n=1 Tax=Paramormyrops kingsleyae TaxID=1676925 RepID=UPI000CD66727|nr:protein Wnt-6-like isoform X2 [Paramormyrops kingsleyae]
MILNRTEVALVFILCPMDIVALWWVSGNLPAMDSNGICQKSRRTAGNQAALCQSQPEVLYAVARGTSLGVRECQHQFRHHQWNCTQQGKSFRRILQQDIRETAFVFAVVAAGSVHTVTQACSSGELLQCGCEDPHGRRPPQLPATFGKQGIIWEWGGCGDDVEFGFEASRRFMDTKRRKTKSDVRTLIDLHNYEAGRLAVRNHMWTECKCHGLSSSCSLKTCWRKMPHFREVGDRLLQRYNSAFRVMGSNDGGMLVPAGQGVKPPDGLDLVYSDESPDFCLPCRRTGSLGTGGRACDSRVTGMGGCRQLCCGRGHKKETQLVELNCLCRFYWCCTVECEKCSTSKNLTLCL